MKYILHIRSNEKGSTLLLSILILLLLTVIGIAATNTSTIEILISGNDKVHKMAFHQADGGTEVGIELVEQNISLAGFDATDLANLGDVNVTTPNLYLNLSTNSTMPSDSNRDAYLPRNYGGNHTNLTIGGNTGLSTGGAIQMAAGYEGKGKSSAGAGSYVVYDIWSQHIGRVNSEAIILLQWMHVM
jgi:Tfp pilus assembly protein PilX